MNKLLIILLVTLLVSCDTKQADESNLSPEMNLIAEWFSAWELIHNEIYKLTTYEPVQFVFFDEKYVYSTSAVTIPSGEQINGPSLLNENLEWKKKEHKGTITLPSGENTPLGLLVFASPLENEEKKTFFIMPLPEFWENAGVKSELPYHLFLSGIFLHEFSHTQQMSGIGAKITELAEKGDFKDDLNDEIVEHLFSNDSTYVNMFELESAKVFQAIEANETVSRITLTQEVLNLIHHRQDKFFVENFSELRELNELFLTMEGVGQLTMYEWLIHPKGGNLPPDIAFNGSNRQDEGFGLALLLSKFQSSSVWGNQVFGQQSTTLTELLALEVEKKDK